MKKISSIALGLVCCIHFSCKKSTNERPIEPSVQELNVSMDYNIDASSLITDTIKYISQAGYKYSVTRLNYFLSQISLIKEDNSRIQLKDFQYIDAVSASSNLIHLENVPIGNYIGLSFNIGLDSIHNKSDALPLTMEINNMVWPDQMGGGFHFLKLEGYFKYNAINYGYAMHLGTNSCLIPIKVYKTISIAENSQTSLNLHMNINEWFRNPNTFDFNTDGNYIMGNMVLMKKITQNGTDVFSF